MLRKSIILVLNKTNFKSSVYFSSVRHNLSDTQNYGFGRLKSVFQPEQLSIIGEYINDKKYVSLNEWEDIKNNLKANRGINSDNVDSIILQYLIYVKKFQLGRDYIKQLKENNTSLNIATLVNIMNLYCMFGRDNLTNEEKQEIIDSYKNVLKKYKILDYKTNSSFARAFLHTNYWKESLTILEIIKQIDKPSKSVYSEIIAAAFDYDDMTLGWNLLEEMFQLDLKPEHVAFSSWLQYSLRMSKDDQSIFLSNLERMLFYCADKDLLMTQDTVLQYKDTFSDVLGWNANFVSIGSNGHCPACKSRLQSVEVSSDEFQLLRNTFYENVLIGKNLFTKSTPEEREGFLLFLEENAPFDIVIDGLNIFYSVPNKKRSDILVNVVKHFVKMKKKILILGRRHLAVNLPKSDLSYLTGNASMFLADDLSYDDIFLLYASLYSEKTQFMSRDIMKSHKFLLKDTNVKAIFKNWQRTRQLIFKFMDSNGKVSFKRPVKYLGFAQKDIGWHIPYSIQDTPLRDTLDIPENWLCLRPKNC